MIKIAVIGTFWLVEEFIKAIKMSDGIMYYAQYSRNIEKARSFGKERGASVFYDDLYKMANDPDIDAVYIASPNMLHYAQSKIFIQAGKHVICEKPISVTAGEYRELLSLAKKHNVIYMEAMLNVHVKWAKELKRLTDRSGGVVCARFDFCQRSSKLDRVEKGMMFSSFDRECCGGALMDLGVYGTSLAAYLFGKPIDIFAQGHFSKNGADLSNTIVLIYDGFECVLTVSKLCESSARSEILCKNTVISMENISQLQMLVSHDSFGIEKNEKRIIHGRNDFPKSMKYEINDFLSYINGNIKEYEENGKLTEMSIETLELIRKKTGYKIKSRLI